MHDIKSRANALFSFAVTVLFSLLAVVAFFSPFIAPPPPPLLRLFGEKDHDNYGPVTASITVNRVHSGRDRVDYYDRRTQDVASIRFDVDADLRPLFHWNTKQLFVSVVAEYEAKDHHINKINLWDNIITDLDDGRIRLRNMANEYTWSQIGDQGLKGLHANISLHWNVIPYVGMLFTDRSRSSKRFELKSAQI